MPITKKYKERSIYMESAHQTQDNEKTTTDRLSPLHFQGVRGSPFPSSLTMRKHWGLGHTNTAPGSSWLLQKINPVLGEYIFMDIPYISTALEVQLIF